MPIPKKVNSDFFKIWTPEMAYVLGFFFADGTLTSSGRGSHYLAFHSVDRSLLVSIRGVMRSTHKVAKRSIRSGEVYRLQIGSKEMFNDLINLGLKTRKTTRLTLPAVPGQYFGDFVRGYFDGDGNVWSGTLNKKRKTPTRVLQISLTSGCVAFLNDLKRLLQRKGISGGSIYSVKNKQCQRLSFSTLDALKLSEIMYNGSPKLYLKRKKLRFDTFIKMRS